MAIEKFNKNMAIIAALDDEPNDVGGMTSAELKNKFDEGGKAIQTYMNETLIPGAGKSGRGNGGAAAAERGRIQVYPSEQR